MKSLREEAAAILSAKTGRTKEQLLDLFNRNFPTDEAFLEWMVLHNPSFAEFVPEVFGSKTKH